MRRLQRERVDNGECPRCGTPAPALYVHCDDCRKMLRERQREYLQAHPRDVQRTLELQRAHRERRKAAGVCPLCGCEIDRPDRVHCRGCREQHNGYRRAWNAKHREHRRAYAVTRYHSLKAAGLCVDCRRPARP